MTGCREWALVDENRSPRARERFAGNGGRDRRVTRRRRHRRPAHAIGLVAAIGAVLALASNAATWAQTFTVTQQELRTGIGNNVTTVTYPGAGSGPADMTVTKTGGSPNSSNMFPITGGNQFVDGIHLGCTWCTGGQSFQLRNEQYEVFFNEPITDFSMLIGALNNNFDGIEELQDIRVFFGSDDRTDASTYTFAATENGVDIPGTCGTPAGFDLATHTIFGNTPSGCDDGGTLTITNAAGFNRVTFTRADIENAPSNNNTNGVSLGPITYTPRLDGCSIGLDELDWAAPEIDWVARALQGSFTIPSANGGDSITLDMEVTGRTDLMYGGTPNDVNTLHDGSGEPSLLLLVNPPNSNDTSPVTVTVKLDQPVTDISFSIFDIDTVNPQAFNGRIDQATITGSLGGVAVTPELSRESANATFTINGNVATGNNFQDISGRTIRGRLDVWFPTAIDQFEILYEEVATSANPAGRGITLHDVNFCAATIPGIDVAKSASPGLPAASGIDDHFDVIYTLVVQNNGFEDLTNLTLTDDLVTQFDSGFVGIVTPPRISNVDATTPPAANTAYDGTGDLLLGGPTDLLEPGQSYIATMTVEVSPGETGAPSPLTNQATATGEDSLGEITSDKSDSGLDPMGTNPDEPGDTGGANDPTPVTFPFICNNDGLVMQNGGGDIGQIDLSSDPAVYDQLGSAGYQASIGYRKTDGLLWGYRIAGGARGIVKIDRRMETEFFGLPTGLPSSYMNVGGVSADGSTMFVQAGNTGSMYFIPLPDLTPVTSFRPTGATGGYHDMASSPVDGLLYTVDANDDLVQIDPATGVRTDTDIPGMPASPLGYGAVWFSNSGNLFAFENTGTIYEIDVTTATILSTNPGPATSLNDGAACFSSLGIAKEMTPAAGIPGTITIDYVFENFDAVESTTLLSSTDDLTAVFGTPGTDWTFTSITANPAALANPTYNGSSIVELLDSASNTTLAPGETATVSVTIELLTLNSVDANGEFCNQAEGFGLSTNGALAGDRSTEGTDPDGIDGDDSADESVPTCLSITAIGVAKEAGTAVPAASGTAGNFDIPYTLLVQNTGTVPLTSLSLVDDLSAQFGSAFVGVTVAPAVTNVDATSPPAPNPDYDGTSAEPDMLIGDTADVLSLGQSYTVTVTIEIDPDAAGAPSPLENQATATGEDPNGEIATDLSDSGTDPTGGDDPTPVSIPVIAAAKSAGVPEPAMSGDPDHFDVPYTFVIQNTGTVTLTNLSLIDDLVGQFGVGFVGITVPPAVSNIDATSPPAPNPLYAGTGDLLIGDPADQLEAGQSFQVTLTVEVDPSAIGVPVPLENQGTVSGDDPGGNTVTDLSDSGTDPTGTNPGAPGDSGGPDDPTPLQFPFVCNNEAYVIQNATGDVTRVDQSKLPLEFQPLGSIGFQSSVAFGTADGLLWGYRLTPAGSRQLITIDASLNVTELGLPAGLPGNFFNVMTISPDGTTLFLMQSNGSSLFSLPIPALTPVTEITLTGDTGAISDLSVSPIDGLLYGVDVDDELVQIDPSMATRVDTLITDLPASPIGYGATWFNGAGNLFAYENDGTLFEIDVNTLAVLSTSPGPASAQNDGTACISRIGIAKDMQSVSGDVPGAVTIDYLVESFEAVANVTLRSAVDDLSQVFGVEGTDWTFTSITSTPSDLANPSFDGVTNTELVNLASGTLLGPGNTASISVEIELLTDAATDPNGEFCNQVELVGQSSTGSLVGDFSTEGTDPDGTDADDSPDESLQTCFSIPLIGAAKAAGIPVPAASGTPGNLDVPYTFVVQNTGMVTLTNLGLVDDMAVQFGSAFVGVTTLPAVTNVDATSPPLPNLLFTGAAPNDDLLAGSTNDVLEADQSFEVTVTIELDPDALGAPLPLANQATASGEDPNGTVVTDLTDSGVDPDTGEDDPTPVVIAAIGSAKAAGTPTPAASGAVGNFDVPYTFIVQNTGSETLTNLSLVDDLSAQFGSVFVAVTVAPAVVNVDATSPPAPNPGYDGTNDLLIGSPADSLESGQSYQVTFTVEVDPDAAGAPDPLENQGTASGTTGGGLVVTDLSDAGTEITGDDDPTPLVLAAIGATKSAGTPVAAASGTIGNFDVPYTLSVQNTGSSDLTNLSLVDDLATQFGSALVGITVAPAVTNVDATSPPAANASYDGTDDMLVGSAADLLEPGQSFQVTLTVEVDPDAAGAPVPLTNQATAQGDDEDGMPVTDVTDNGTDITGDDDPTPLVAPQIGAAKEAGVPADAASGTIGNFDVPYTFVVQNTGSEPLTSLGLIDDLTAQFGSAFVGVAVAPQVINVDATSPPAANAGYDGTNNLLVPDLADLLEPGQSFQVTVTIEVDPDADAAPDPLENQATAAGTDPAGTVVTDDTDAGSDPAGENGPPGEDDPTPLMISTIGVAKEAGTPVAAASGTLGNYDVPFTFVIQNTGNEPLIFIRLADDLGAQFGSALVGITTTPEVTNIDATLPPPGDTNYTGIAPDIELLQSEPNAELQPGESFQVTLTVEIDPDAAGAPGPLENQATASGNDPSGETVTDDSDSGTDPKGDNGEGGGDDPTPVEIADLGVAKEVTNVLPTATMGQFEVEYTVIVQNTGNVTLTNLTLVDDIATELGSTFIGVVNAPVIDTSDATIDPGLGTFPPDIFDGMSGQLDPGQSIGVIFSIEVDPDAAGAPSPLENQATGGGDDPDGNTVTDDSDAGADPKGDNGEGGEDDPTPLELPAIGAAKAAGTATPAISDTPGNFDVPYTLVVRNVGTVNLVNLSLVDDIVDQLGAAFVGITSPPTVINVDATVPPAANLGYTGVAPDNDLIDGFSSELLEPGQSFEVEVTIEIDPDADGVVLPLTNQATAGATDPDENPISDDTDSGTDPSGDNPGEPGDTGGTDDPTPVSIPQVGVAKAAGTPVPAASGVMGNFDVEYTFAIQNTGTEPLTNLSLVDDLSAQFGGALVAVTVAPVVDPGDASSAPAPNPAYDGTAANSDLLLGGPADDLQPTEMFSVTVTVELDPDAPGALVPLANLATASGDDPNGTPISDDSDSGTDPKGNNGEGGGDDPTPVSLPAIGIAKQAGTPTDAASGTTGNVDVEYTLIVKNTGTETLNSLTATDDLMAQFGSAFVGVAVAPTVVNIDATTPPAANAAYDGTATEPDLLVGIASDALEAGQSFQITVTVEIDPDADGALRPLANQATATGTDDLDMVATDSSDSGTDPGGDNPGEPGDMGTPDDPTPLPVSQLGVAKAAGTPVDAGGGLFDVDYTFVFRNTGTEPLTNLSLVDDLSDQFGGAFVAVVAAPAVTNVDATAPPAANAAYDGTATEPDLLVPAGTDNVEAGQSFEVSLTIQINPAAPDAILPLLNQATGSGDDPDGDPVTDDSDSGSDPKGDNPGEDGDTGGPDDPTPTTVAAIGAAKAASAGPAASGVIGNLDVEYSFVVQAAGTETLTNLSLVDDLSAQLGGAFLGVVTAPEVVNVDATSPPVANAGYTGIAPDDDLLVGGPADAVEPGQSFSVTVTVEIDPDADGAVTPLANQGTASGDDPDGITVQDLSDSGTDPVGDNPGEPGDSGGEDDPTPITSTTIGIAKSAGTPVPAASGTLGNIDVPYTFVVQNTGTEPLTLLSIADDLTAGDQLGNTFVTVSVAPVVTNVDATSPPAANDSYDGTDDLLVPDAADLLESGQSFEVTVTVEVDPDAPGAPSPLANQATAGGEDPNDPGVPITDDSDSGTDPGGDNPGEPGDMGTPDDPTPLSVPAIGVAKAAGTPVPATSGTAGNVDVEYTFVVQNTGMEPLSSLSLTDDLTADLGGAFVGVVTAPLVTNVDATSPPLANAAYDGTAANADLLVGDSANNVEADQSFSVAVTVEIDPDAGTPPLTNQATATGTDPMDLVTSDVSDSGSDPDGDNPGEPGDMGTPDDPTPLTVTAIAVAKAAGTPTPVGGGLFDVEYTFVVENTGTETMRNLTLVDDLATQFGAGVIDSIPVAPVVTNVDATSPPDANAGYTGAAPDDGLITPAPANRLESGQSFSVTVTVRISPTSPDVILPLENQATGGGESPTETVTDLSDSGSDPDSNNPGENGDTGGPDDPTPTTISAIGVAKAASLPAPAASGVLGNFDVEYTFVVRNNGTQDLLNLSLTDDLAAELRGAFVDVVTAPVVTNVDATSPPGENPAYDGTAANDDLLVGGPDDLVESGQSFEVAVTIEIDPDAAGAVLPLANQATASAENGNGVNVQDQSDSGTDPVGDNPDEPGDTGGEDDPTPVVISLMGVAKTAGDAAPSASGTPGNFDIPFTFVVQNTGTEPLSNLSLVDDLVSQLGSAFIEVTVAPEVINIDATAPPMANPFYTGGTGPPADEMLIGSPADLLESMQSFQVTVTVEVDPNADGAPSPLENQATGSATDPNDVVITDDSDSGSDPTGTNPDDPGDMGTPDDPTPLMLPGIGVAKSVASVAPNGDNFDVEFLFVIENTGNEPLTSLVLADDLAVQLGGGFVGVIAAPSVDNIDATSPPLPNDLYDGTGDLLVADLADNLEPGQMFEVWVTVEIDPDSETAVTPLANQGEAAGTDPNGMVATDLSDSGTDPMGSNPDEPGDSGGGDDPTPIEVSDLTVEKTDELTDDADGSGDLSGGDTITYTVTVINSGTAEQTDVVFDDMLDANTALVTGSVATDVGVVVSGNNAGDQLVSVAIGALAAAETATITFDVTVNDLLVPASGEEVIFASVGLGPTELYEIDPETLEATFRMEFTFDQQVHAIATCGSADFLYAIGKATRELVFVDLAVEPPTETVVADLSGEILNPIVQLACDSTGILYFSDEETEELLTIDPATCPACTADVVGTIETTPGAADVNTSGIDLVLSRSNRLYLATNLPTPSLYRVDPTTAIARFVGEIPTPEFSFGITALADGRLVLTSNDSHLYEIDPLTAEVTDLGQPEELGVPVTLQWGDAAGAVPASVGTLSNQGLVTSADSAGAPTDDPDTDLTDDPTITVVGTRVLLDAMKTAELTDDADGSGGVSAGDTLEYTVAVANLGNADDDGVFFRDVPGAGSALVEGSVTTTQGTVVQGNGAGDVVVEVDLEALTAGAVATITYQATVDGAEAVIENQGTVTSITETSGILTDDPATDPVDDPTRTAREDAILLSALKTDQLIDDRDGDGVASPRDTLHYTIELTNLGGAQAASVVFGDIPDPSTTLVIGSVTTTSGAVVAGNNPGDTAVSISIPTIDPEGVVSIGFDVTINVQVASSTIVNHGSVSALGATVMTDDAATVEIEDATVTKLGPAPNLAVTKEDGGARPIPGEVLVYTLNYSNVGGRNAASVVITETVPTSTTYDEAGSTPGWSCADGDPAGTVCTFDLGDLAVGDADSVDFAVLIDDPFPIGANLVENTVSIADDGTAGVDEAPDDNVDICTTPVLVEADLAVEKIAVFDPVMAGEVQSYEVTVTNNGPAAATEVELVDVLPADALLVSADLSCIDTDGTLTCDLGSLLPGETAEVTINVLVDHFFEGTLTNEASVSSPEDDPDETNNGVSVDSEVAPRMIIKSIADIDGDGTADVAVLFRDAGVTQVFVKNAVTGRPIQTIALDAEFFPVDLEVMPNFAGGAADELAVLARDPATGTTRVFVYDAGDGSVLATRGYSAAYLPCDLEIVPDLDGSGVDELAVLERNPDTGVARSQLKDPLVAGAIANVFPPTGFFPVDLEVLDVDLTGTVVEIAVLATETATGAVATTVHDAATGALSTTVDFPTWVAQELEALADTDGGGAPELALLAHQSFTDKGRVITKDRATAAEINRITLPLGQVARDMEVVPNFADTDADELAIALTRNSDGRARIFTKDPVSRATLSRLQQSAAEVPYDIDVVPDVGDSTADEIATLGSDGTPLATIRDAQTGGLIRFVFVP